MDTMTTGEILKITFPLILLQGGLFLYCLIDILKRGTRNLNKPLWIILCSATTLVGSIAYLLLGRRTIDD